MAHTNIDLFNRFALALFAKLHESFPVPANLDFESIMMSVIPDDEGYEDPTKLELRVSDDGSAIIVIGDGLPRIKSSPSITLHAEITPLPLSTA